MRIVLDTNIFISGIFWDGNPNRIIRLWAENRFILIISDEIIEEIIRVMKDFKIRLPDDIIKEWSDLITENATLVKPKEKFNIIKEDQSDNKFLECAYAGKAEYIISNDKHLLKLNDFKNIKIINPEEFIKIIDRN